MKPGFLLLLMLGAVVGTVDASTPAEQLKQLTAQLQRNPKDAGLREKIIKLAQTMKPAPTVPAEAERFDGRGEYAFKSAKNETDYLAAAREFRNATNAAPWVAPYYFNAGTAYEKAQRPAAAKRNFEFYLLADPNAKDAREVRRRIAGLEYAVEREISPAAIAASVEPYRGNFIALRCLADKNMISSGCTDEEFRGQHWYKAQDFENGGMVVVYEFQFNHDGTVEIRPPASTRWKTPGLYGPYGMVSKIVGAPTGAPLVGSLAVEGSRLLEWTCHYDSSTQTNKALSRRITETSFLLSCDLPPSAKLPNDIGGSSFPRGTRYRFIEFRRQ